MRWLSVPPKTYFPSKLQYLNLQYFIIKAKIWEKSQKKEPQLGTALLGAIGSIFNNVLYVMALS